MNRLLVTEDMLEGGDRARVTGDRAAHIRRVLRADVGSTIRIGRVDGPRGTGAIVSMDEAGVTLDCRWEDAVPPPAGVDLLLALPRPKVLKRLWPVLAALGVDRIILLNAWKVEKAYFAGNALDAETIRAGLIEGVEQAGATRLPEVMIRRRFRPFVEDELDALCGGAARMMADPAAERWPVDCIRMQPEAPVVGAIGPEGGWTPFEQDMLAARGFRSVSLGPRILRSDTACVALLTRIQAAREATRR